MKRFDRWVSRLLALFDGSAWFLILPALAWMWYRDPPLVKSIVEWTLLFLVLAGIAVMVSRIVFPHLDLGAFLTRAAGGDGKPGDVAAAIVVAALIIFVAWIMQTIAGWARPIGSVTGG